VGKGNIPNTSCDRSPHRRRSSHAPATKRRRAAGTPRQLCAGVAFMDLYFPLGMKHMNYQFIQVSPNAAFRLSHYTHLNLF